jgi:hypothetical protein
MPTLTTDTLCTVLWGLAATAVAWVCLPNVMQLLGQTRFESETDEDAAAIEPTGDDPEYAALVADLRRLGFEPLGIRWTTGRFYCGHWVKTFRSPTFATPRRDCFASVWRFFPNDPWRLGFLTAFTDGGLVESANQMESFKIQEERHWRWGFATPDRGELLGRHRELVEQYTAEHGCTVDNTSLQRLGELLIEHEGRWFRKDAAVTALAQLGGTLVLIAAPALAVGSLVGWDGWLLPLAVFGGTIRHVVGSIALFRQAARQFRQEDAAGGHTSGEPAA